MKWINGLYPCSKYPGVKIFRASLLSCQDDFERVEVDDGYIRESPFMAKRYGTKGRVSEADAYQKTTDLVSRRYLISRK
jgi:hypothetical protein